MGVGTFHPGPSAARRIRSERCPRSVYVAGGLRHFLPGPVGISVGSCQMLPPIPVRRGWGWGRSTRIHRHWGWPASALAPVAVHYGWVRVRSLRIHPGLCSPASGVAPGPGISRMDPGTFHPAPSGFGLACFRRSPRSGYAVEDLGYVSLGASCVPPGLLAARYPTRVCSAGILCHESRDRSGESWIHPLATFPTQPTILRRHLGGMNSPFWLILSGYAKL